MGGSAACMNPLCRTSIDSFDLDFDFRFRFLLAMGRFYFFFVLPLLALPLMEKGCCAWNAALEAPTNERSGVWSGGICFLMALWSDTSEPTNLPPFHTFLSVPVNRPLKVPSADSWLSWQPDISSTDAFTLAAAFLTFGSVRILS